MLIPNKVQAELIISMRYKMQEIEADTYGAYHRGEIDVVADKIIMLTESNNGSKIIIMSSDEAISEAYSYLDEEEAHLGEGESTDVYNLWMASKEEIVAEAEWLIKALTREAERLSIPTIIGMDI